MSAPCDNCRQTERNLAAAYMRIQSLTEHIDEFERAGNLARATESSLEIRRAAMLSEGSKVRAWLKDQE